MRSTVLATVLSAVLPALLMAALSAVVVCGCGGRPAVGVRADAGPADSGFKDGLARDTCPCASSQVQLRGSCVPTDKLWTCGVPCSPVRTQPCSTGQWCEKCAGAPPCGGSACRAACVPDPNVASWPGGALRITPTVAKAGQPVKLSIEGGIFYWGSGWSVRLGSGTPSWIDYGSALSCKITVTVTPPKPGPYPVELAYGKGGPSAHWSLAGFLVATAGTTPPIWIQPGRPCSSQYPCASAAPYACTCLGGRCGCKK